MTKLIIFLIFITNTSFSIENHQNDKMKTCLASLAGVWKQCNSSQECFSKKILQPNINCSKDIVIQNYPLDKTIDSIIVIKSKTISQAWILDTRTKTMIKI